MILSLFFSKTKLYTRLFIFISFTNIREYLSLLFLLLLLLSLITNENKKIDIFNPTNMLSFEFQSIP